MVPSRNYFSSNVPCGEANLRGSSTPTHSVKSGRRVGTFEVNNICWVSCYRYTVDASWIGPFRRCPQGSHKLRIGRRTSWIIASI